MWQSGQCNPSGSVEQPWAYSLCRVEADADDALAWKADGPPPAPSQGQAWAKVDVLLVEDDAPVRECLAEVLGDAGWRVGEAAGAAGALDRIATDGMPGALVTDLALGRGMSGLALIDAARLWWPGGRAVLIGGTDMAEPALDPCDRFPRKPFHVDTLTRAVSDLAAGQGVAGLEHALS